MVVAAMGMAEGSGDSRAGETVAILDWRDRDGGRGQPASGAGARSSRAQRPSRRGGSAGGRTGTAGGWRSRRGGFGFEGGAGRFYFVLEGREEGGGERRTA